jgi:hypothetical protein
MKPQLLAVLSAVFILTSCGDSASEKNTNERTEPSLPFSQVTNSIPLTTAPLADYLIYASDVPAEQVNILRQDLALVDSWDGLMSASESQKLRDLLGLNSVGASDLSLWFKERIKYILQSDLSRYELGLVFGRETEVGLQELGATETGDEGNTGGGNIGTAIYLTTLEEQRSRSNLSYLIIRIDDRWVSVLSPRVGLMRIGPALFDPDYQVNHTNIRALSNSLQRLEVLFHEARHSDGNQASGSVGFAHINCPSDGTIPPELVGVPACDDMANGAYSVGAAVLKSLLHLCERRCTAIEQEVLRAIYLDRISRVTAGTANGSLKLLDPTPETGFNAVNISDFQAFNLR